MTMAADRPGASLETVKRTRLVFRRVAAAAALVSGGLWLNLSVRALRLL